VPHFYMPTRISSYASCISSCFKYLCMSSFMFILTSSLKDVQWDTPNYDYHLWKTRMLAFIHFYQVIIYDYYFLMKPKLSYSSKSWIFYLLAISFTLPFRSVHLTNSNNVSIDKVQLMLQLHVKLIVLFFQAS
jgi:hypothetical protein